MKHLTSQLLRYGPQGTFCEFVELALQLSESSFTVGEVEEDPTWLLQNPLNIF